MNFKHYAKRIFSLIIVCTLLFTLSGCIGNQADMTLRDDGTCSVTLRFLYENSYYNLLQESKSMASTSSSKTTEAESEPDYAIESGDFTEGSVAYGKFNYHCFSRDFSFATYDEMKNFLSDRNSYINGLKQDSKNPAIYDKVTDTPLTDVTMTATLFKAEIGGSTKNSEKAGGQIEQLAKGDGSGASSADNLNILDYYQNNIGFRQDFTITMPNAIIASNGRVNGNSVTWELAEMSPDGIMIADAGSGYLASDTTPPVITIKGTKKGKKNVTLVSNTSKVTASDDVCLQSISLDGQKLGGIDSFDFGDANLVDGKHTITATDAAGNQSMVKVTLDQTKPTIKGVKNNKTYKKKVTLKFNDKNGIKKITINGKTIKKSTKSKTIRKRGSYTVKVTDTVGNQNKVKFKIK